MRLVQPGWWRRVIFTIAIASFLQTLVGFAQARSYVEDAQEYLKKGDLKSALADALLCVPERAADLPAGAEVEAWLLDDDA